MATGTLEDAKAAQAANGGTVVDLGNGKASYEKGGMDEAEEQALLSNSNSQDLAAENLAFQQEVAGSQLELAAAQVEIAQQQQAMSEEQYKYWKTTFKPLEKDVAEQARVGIDPNYMAARAGSDVTASFAKSKDQAALDASRLGIDASSARYQQQMDALAIAQAAAEAGAKTTARYTTMDVNQQRLMNAVSIGRNLPTTAASISGQAANTYGSAAGTQRGAASTYQQGIDTSMSANQSAINSAQFNASMDANAAAANSAAVAGTAGAVAQTGALITTKVIVSCIPEGTFIDLPDGNAMDVASVRAGDLVVGFDGKPAKILHKHEYAEENGNDFIEIVFADDRIVRACRNHVVDERPAGAYKVGDAINGNRIKAIIPMPKVRISYDLLTSGPHAGYRIGGAPVRSMIPMLVEKAAERYLAQQGEGR